MTEPTEPDCWHRSVRPKISTGSELTTVVDTGNIPLSLPYIEQSARRVTACLRDELDRIDGWVINLNAVILGYLTSIEMAMARVAYQHSIQGFALDRSRAEIAYWFFRMIAFPIPRSPGETFDIHVNWAGPRNPSGIALTVKSVLRDAIRSGSAVYMEAVDSELPTPIELECREVCARRRITNETVDLILPDGTEMCFSADMEKSNDDAVTNGRCDAQSLAHMTRVLVTLIDLASMTRRQMGGAINALLTCMKMKQKLHVVWSGSVEEWERIETRRRNPNWADARACSMYCDEAVARHGSVSRPH